MKMHKFEIHVLDFEGRGPELYRELLNNVRHVVGKAYHVDTVDIGNWNDEHPLNKTNAISAWNKYYDEDEK